ncbi:MAG: ERCC4 domain-containing protein [Candidatus Pacebacteria bacterium]|jgi:ERCC4-type nuclease|nr:ERCC4 domain-containing protein [Candidatus Paceibacterota bacterium]
MLIKIDNREDNKTIKAIQKYFPDICEVTQNDNGDVLITRTTNPDVMIELKTVPDYISSYTSRHIQEQVLRMKEEFPYCFIIIYGTFDDVNTYYQRFSKKQYYGNIVSLTMRYKVPVIQVESRNDMLVAIDMIINNINKETEPIEPPIVQAQDKSAKVKMLMGVNHVGKKTAKLLLSEFHTPQNVLNATDKELLSVKGIGNTVVNGINEVR